MLNSTHEDIGLLTNSSVGFFSKRNNRYITSHKSIKQKNKNLETIFTKTKIRKLHYSVLKSLINFINEQIALTLVVFNFGKLTCDADPTTGRCTEEELEHLLMLALRVSSGINFALLSVPILRKVFLNYYRSSHWDKFFNGLSSSLKKLSFNTIFLQELILSFKFPDPTKPTYLSSSAYIKEVFLPAICLGLFVSSHKLLNLFKHKYPLLSYNPIIRTSQKSITEANFTYGLFKAISLIKPLSLSLMRYTAVGIGFATILYGGLDYLLNIENNGYLNATFLFDYLYHAISSLPIYASLFYITITLLTKFLPSDNIFEPVIYFTLIFLLELANSFWPELEESDEIVNRPSIIREIEEANAVPTEIAPQEQNSLLEQPLSSYRP